MMETTIMNDKWLRRFVICFLAIGQIIVFMATAQNHATIETRVDALFSKWDSPNSPGCALAVIQDGKTIYKKGYGMADLEHDIAITPASVFYIGSTSKQFVTMSILLLEEQGKLSLDDNIREYLPEMPEYDRPITIRHLFHHTSGIRDYLTLWSLAGRSYLDFMSEDAVFAMICRQKELNFSPGDRYLYSNSCYFLLSIIVKRASGFTLREYAEKHIFRPLRMVHSHFHDDVEYIIKNRAFGYSEKDDGSFGNLHMRFSLVGSGGLYTNVEDLFLWDQNFYKNKLGKGGPELIKKMLTNGKLADGTKLDYAAALRNGTYRGLRTVDHGGALGGYRAQLLRFPDQKFSVIILANVNRFNPSRMAQRVADIYLENELDPIPSQADRTGRRDSGSRDDTLTFRLSDQDRDSMIGRYYSDELDISYIITSEQEGQFIRAGHNPKITITALRKDRFRVDGMTLTFHRDGNDEITGFSVDAGRVTDIKFAKVDNE